MSNAVGLKLKGVSFRWPSGEPAINDCNMLLTTPGLWMLAGNNGSGKSTLLKLIGGLLDPQDGCIYRPTRTSLVFQNPDHQLLLPSCGSELLLHLPRELPQARRHHQVRCSLEEVGLMGMASRPVHTLSGGQKQRLAIAGALASQADLLLLDEPTALLDPISQRSVLTTVLQLCRRPHLPLTALWVTHRLDELEEADGAAWIQNGSIGPWQSGYSLRRKIEALAARQR